MIEQPEPGLSVAASGAPSPWHLFDVFGVELEYMIVRAGDLGVLPAADRVLHAVAGCYESEVELGEAAWSNELVLHVIEVKTNGPAPTFDPLPRLFQENVGRMHEILRPLGARLMPTAMHPWMDPHAEMRLWPHEHSPIYEAYHRIFDCRGHGWANLQAVHLNLPFCGDEELGRLHAAIRLVLPILPALAASSPVMERRLTGWMDTRLEVYRLNSGRIPAIAGAVIPEPVFTRADYEEKIFRPMYEAIRPLDPQGILRHEFLNSRGAIARFDRGALEIRVLDMQECPAADVAVCAATVAALRAIAAERWRPIDEQKAVPTDTLVPIMLACIRDAEEAVIADRAYLDHLGYPVRAAACTAGDLWRHLAESTPPWPAGSLPAWNEALRTILDRGPLARRIVRALGGDLSPRRLRGVYGALCDCLREGRVFVA